MVKLFVITQHTNNGIQPLPWNRNDTGLVNFVIQVIRKNWPEFIDLGNDTNRSSDLSDALAAFVLRLERWRKEQGFQIEDDSVSEAEESHSNPRNLSLKSQVRQKMIEDAVVDENMISSGDYLKRLEQIDFDKAVVKAIKSQARRMLRHRSGTLFEDLVFIDSENPTAKDGILIQDSFAETFGPKNLMEKGRRKQRLTDEEIDQVRQFEKRVYPSRKMTDMFSRLRSGVLITIHNHPNSSVPSEEDILNAWRRKSKYGVVLGHNGSIFKYSVDLNVPMPERGMLKVALRKLDEIRITSGYNELKDGKDSAEIIKSLKQLGVVLEVL